MIQKLKVQGQLAALAPEQLMGLTSCSIIMTPMTPTSSTDKYFISSFLTHLAEMVSHIARTSDWKKTLDGPGADPELEDDLYDAINALSLIADKYAQAADYQAAIREDHANDNAEIARLFEEQPSP